MKGLQLVIACLCVYSVQSLAPRLDGRVIGGEVVEIEQYPYQVSLQHNGAHICGATLISDRFVLTAAHCTDGTYESELSVRLGSSYHAQGGVVVRVSKTNQHEDYDSDNMYNDITVLELTESVQYSAGIQPVRLTSYDPSENSEVVISGWGRTSGGNPSQLNAAIINVVNKQTCVENYKDINDVNDDMFCAAAPLKDACQGDSGGPLVGNGQLVGVVSWGYGCAQPQYPGVYTSVANMRDFIYKYAQV